MNRMVQKNKWGFSKVLNSLNMMFLISLIFLSANTISAQGSAVNFDGNGNPAAYNYSVDYISIPSDPALNLNGDFTIELWFQMETTGGWPNPSEAFYQPDWHTLISKGYWGNANEFCILVTSNTLYAGINGQAYLAPANIQTNQWYHMALTRNNGLLQFYLNGNLLPGGSGTQNNSANINNTKELRIGKNYGFSKFGYSDSHAYGFDGSIDEVRIWNVARTQTEIAENMNLNNLCDAAGLVADFAFDENAGTTVSSSVGGYVGTLINGATWAQGVSVSSCAPLQTLTILGGFGTQGQIDSYTEASRDGGLTWQPAYLTGWHPWGFAEGTNSWINFDPSPFVGLNTTTDYRIRFNIPADFSDPHMTFVLKADNRAWLSINGTNLGQFDGAASGAAGDQVIAQALRAGENEINIKLQDFGGWVGLNYRIDITMRSNEVPVLVPAPAPNTAPTANAGEDQIINCALLTGAEVTLNGSGTDADNDVLSYSWSNGATTASQTLTLAPGTHTLTLTVNDGKGGLATDNVSVTVNADAAAPVPALASLADITGECSAAVTVIPTATDACEGTIAGTTSDPLEYTAQGSYIITWSYSDANGNTSTQTQNVIVKDVTAPELTTPEAVRVELGVSIQAVYTGPGATAIDNCDASPVVTSVPALPASFTSPGDYVITYTATDANGNSSTSEQQVTVYQTLMFEKTSTIAALEALKTGDKKTDKKIEEAQRHIKKSLEPDQWVDEYHLDPKKGKKVFEEEKEAVQQLREVLKRNGTAQETKDGVTAVMLTLVNVDRGLAQLSIDEVTQLCADTKCEKNLQKAYEEMGKAEKEVNKGNYDKAIEEFKSAWEKVSEEKHGHKNHGGRDDDHGKDDHDGKGGEDDHDGDDDHGFGKAQAETVEIVTPTEFALNQNYPNPFNPSTTIQVAIPEAGYYTLKVYNMLGQEVANILSGQLGSGIYSFNFDGKELSTGIFIYSLKGNNVNISKKMSLMK